MAKPMSDERLAALHREVRDAREREQRTNSTGAPTWHEALAEALAEVGRLRAALARVTDDRRRESDIGMAVTFGVMRGLALGPDQSDASNGKCYDATFLADTIRQHVFDAIEAVAAGEQRSFSEAIAPITKQSKQWAEAVAAGEQGEPERDKRLNDLVQGALSAVLGEQTDEGDLSVSADSAQRNGEVGR